MTLGASICVKGSVEAAAFYQNAFGLTSAHHGINPDGTYGHVELQRDGKAVFSFAESGSETRGMVDMILSGELNPVMQFSVDFETKQEVRAAFDILSQGGRVISPIEALPWSPCCASVVDRYGVWWFIHMPADKRPTAKEVEKFFGWDKSG